MSLFLTPPIGEDGQHIEPLVVLDVAEERAKLGKIEQVTIALTKKFEDMGRVFDEGQAADLARAAIEAMREPTEKMVWEGERVAPEVAEYALPGDTSDIWRAMIDEALAEK